jgi:hypothetical protein
MLADSRYAGRCGAASFAYVDCHELIEIPAVRMIHVTRAAGVPLLLNLGRSPFSAVVADALSGHPRLIVQTNVDDADHGDALQLAATLISATISMHLSG